MTGSCDILIQVLHENSCTMPLVLQVILILIVIQFVDINNIFKMLNDITATYTVLEL